MVAVVDQAVAEELQVAGNWMYKVGLGHYHGAYLRRKYFPDEFLAQLTERIHTSESKHAGELVVAIEVHNHNPELDNCARAHEVFGRLRVWDTPHDTGVLLYIGLDRHAIEIISDRGVAVSNTQWQSICNELGQAFSANHYQEGIEQAIIKIETLLAQACGDLPVDAENILPNAPVIL